MRALFTVAALAVASTAAVPKAQKVYRAADSDFIAEYREVVRDSAQWRNVWALSGGREVAGKSAKAPNINFNRKMVIVAAGPAANAPDSVVILVDPKGAKGVFTVVSYRSCESSAPKTFPIDIIAVPADPGSVLFREKAVRGPSCASAAK